jgi:hypothetical protein
MKELTGKPIDIYDSFCLTFGNDWQWWLAPTHPVLKINYLEKLYSQKDIRKNRIKEFEEDDSDPDKKFLVLEERKSS